MLQITYQSHCKSTSGNVNEVLGLQVYNIIWHTQWQNCFFSEPSTKLLLSILYTCSIETYKYFHFPGSRKIGYSSLLLWYFQICFSSHLGTFCMKMSNEFYYSCFLEVPYCGKYISACVLSSLLTMFISYFCVFRFLLSIEIDFLN